MSRKCVTGADPFLLRRRKAPKEAQQEHPQPGQRGVGVGVGWREAAESSAPAHTRRLSFLVPRIHQSVWQLGPQLGILAQLWLGKKRVAAQPSSVAWGLSVRPLLTLERAAPRTGVPCPLQTSPGQRNTWDPGGVSRWGPTVCGEDLVGREGSLIQPTPI